MTGKQIKYLEGGGRGIFASIILAFSSRYREQFRKCMHTVPIPALSLCYFL
jgi:hypothetical protein